MPFIRRSLFPCCALAALCLTAPALADTPAQILAGYQTAARAQTPGFGAVAARGAEFFRNDHGQAWRCASCHTADPTKTGRHASTGKTIRPLAVAANAERFTQPDKVEKWFARNCKDVLGRECSAAEKADLVAFLSTAK